MDSEIGGWLLRILGFVVLLGMLGWLLLASVRSKPIAKPRLPSADMLPGRTDKMAQSTNGEHLRIRSKLYYYAAHVTSVYDGDTITVDVDLGLGIWRRNQTIRLWKINTPEIRGPERQRGIEVRDFLRGYILDQDILLRTILDKRGEDQTGKFGRLLGEILVEDEDGQVININDLLLQQGMAVPLDEGGSAVVTEERRIQQPPDAVACPFCGELRRIDPESELMEPCPNCLAPAQPWRG